jgi:hypothetical protein
MSNTVVIKITRSRLKYLIEELDKDKKLRSPVLLEGVVEGIGSTSVMVKAIED